ncbi:hypothetical protein BJ684DRAFT_19213 [Piptocephalis cylindrospora]|uniref:Uncharacterized protein n=1 Tax=Piptocephalis cylindrospora TaxID=1907219 RepID=A0A4V1IYF4_9FUNG|nr:hypothetical protein BJ684DRAFT_19213 [Piptocephalis cylindrospora]|eukprot:RKP14369.1 hypothetical protein BJ684DRAFT_19213 [Piptocephalis cylindrospora]
MHNGKNALKQLGRTIRQKISRKKRREGEERPERKRKGRMPKWLKRLKVTSKKREARERPETKDRTMERERGERWRESAVTVVHPPTPPKKRRPDELGAGEGRRDGVAIWEEFATPDHPSWKAEPASNYNHEAAYKSNQFLDHDRGVRWQEHQPNKREALFVGAATTSNPVNGNVTRTGWSRYNPEGDRPQSRPTQRPVQPKNMDIVEGPTSQVHGIKTNGLTLTVEDLDPWEDLLLVPRPIMNLAWNMCYAYLQGVQILEWVLGSTVDYTLHLHTAEQIRHLLDPIPSPNPSPAA